MTFLFLFIGKPSPPDGTPSLRNVTHNSLTVVWSPPQNQRIDEIIAYRVELYCASNKRWKVVTNCCQGNSYDVKDLKPDSEYCLRIRAENIFGWSKPSQCTHLIRTRCLPNRRSMFENEEAKNSKLVRRHSYHIKIEPKVATMLFTKTEETSDFNSVGTFPFRRNSSIRLSLPIQRKTVTNLFSDHRHDSISSHDPRRRSVGESSVCTDETDESMKSLKLHRVSMSTEDDSCARSTSSTSMSSIPEVNEDLPEMNVIPEMDVKINSFMHVDNSNLTDCHLKQNWISPIPEVSHDDILTSPYSDDTKLSMFNQTPIHKQSNHVNDFTTTSEKNHLNDFTTTCEKASHYNDLDIWKGSSGLSDYDNISDLSSLRDMLYSSDLFADTNGNYSCGKLFQSAIPEVDEEQGVDRESVL